MNLEKDNKKGKLLLFSGGFFGGLLHVGAIRGLESKGFDIFSFDTIVGISAGSIVSFFLLLGIRTEDIVVAATEIVELESKCHPKSIGDFICSFGNASLIDSQKFFIGLCDIFDRTVGASVSSLTFADLHKTTRKKLVVVSTDVNGNPKYFSVETDPNVTVSLAIMSSISIPSVFKPVTIEGKTYYDGCLSDPCPMVDPTTVSQVVYFRIVDTCHASLFLPYNIVRNVVTRLEESKYQLLKNNCDIFLVTLITISLKAVPTNPFESIDRDKAVEMILDGFKQLVKEFDSFPFL